MASTINASTAGAGGLISTADASGVLQLQTASTTALTINASQNATFAGTVAATSYTGDGSSLSNVGGMTLLGTITATAVNSLSLGSLTLTNYKSLYIVMNGLTSGSITTNNIFISSNNQQSGGGIYIGAKPITIYGTAWLDLGTGCIGGSASVAQPAATNSIFAFGGQTNVSTSSTTIYFRIDSTTVFSASGSIVIYGVK